MRGAATESASQTSRLLAAGILFVVTCALFWRSTSNDFVAYDDPKCILQNRQVLRGLTPEGAVWAFNAGYFASWHPLTWLSHMADVELFETRPAGHHATSVVLFALATSVLFLALRAATGSTWRAAIATALFAWHPLRVQSVAWVAERKDVLALLFGLLALYAYTRYARRPSMARYAAVLAFAALSLMSKAIWVTLPALLLLWDVWPLDRPARGVRWKRLILEKVPLLLLSVGASVLTYIAQSRGGAVSAGESFTIAQRIGNAIVAYVRYLVRFVWPVDLAAYYPHPGTWPIEVVAASAALLVLLTIAVIAARRRCPYVFVGWLWFLGALVPMIGLVQVGSQSMADRYTLVPMIGLTVALVWLAADVLPRHVPLRALLAGAVALGLAARTWVEIGYWRNTQALFTRALEVTGPNFMAHVHLATELSRQEEDDEAAGHFDAALRLAPRYAPAHFNFANLLMRRGDAARAMHHFGEAARFDPQLAAAHLNLGVLLARQGRMDDAAASFGRAVAADPLWPEAHLNVALAEAARGNTEAARRAFRRVLELDPANTVARRRLEALSPVP